MMIWLNAKNIEVESSYDEIFYSKIEVNIAKTVEISRSLEKNSWSSKPTCLN
jgi:hypothetical protein